MGAPKTVWQILKIIAAIFAITVTGLTFAFSFDTGFVLSSTNTQSGTITPINATHYQLPITASFNHTGFIYQFNIYVSVDIYVNTTVEAAVNQTPSATANNIGVVLPGGSTSVPLTLIFEQTLWDTASSVILGFNITISGLLYNYSISSVSLKTYQQVK
ncbi:MAG: hypothetical protein ACTSQY_05710 [Candidatus Odinarchaeia archaeon]